jgi:peptidyl-prolyl cis-trans isomerase SurA
MKYTVAISVLLLAIGVSGQVASHAPTIVAKAPSTAISPLAVTGKPVARVNGVVLTDRDLLREMYSIFPYARQHNGFPKAQEESIRQGALQMIIFEELVYEDALRRKITVPASQVTNGEAEFRKQFDSPDQFDQYLKSEMHGSRQYLRKQIERSLMIEKVLKTDVQDKSTVSTAEVRAYYEKNPTRFEQPESFSFQSISIIPPLKATPEQEKQGRQKAEDALKQAQATKNYRDFGLLAEKISEDDFRVNMGDHRTVARDKLPPQVVKALLSIKPGQVSDIIQIETAFTIIRLNAHTAAHKQSFAEVKGELAKELQKAKYERLRSELAKRLRAKAKIEIV